MVHCAMSLDFLRFPQTTDISKTNWKSKFWLTYGELCSDVGDPIKVAKKTVESSNIFLPYECHKGMQQDERGGLFHQGYYKILRRRCIGQLCKLPSSEINSVVQSFGRRKDYCADMPKQYKTVMNYQRHVLSRIPWLDGSGCSGRVPIYPIQYFRPKTCGSRRKL